MRPRSHHGKLKKVFRRKTVCLAMIMLWMYGLALSGIAYGAPQGGVVTSGSAAIVQSGNTTNINQSTQKAAINWQSFSVKPVETVSFNQPNASSITLNRVIGNEKSIIEGTINATGRVFLLNSNGVLLTGTSSVNTAGFVASTLNLTDEDFNTGNYVFKANTSTGSVINMGTITARDGGYVALLGNSVSNQGVITATRGTVALASGDKVSLNFNGDSLLNVTVDESTLNSLVENRNAVYADGGKVIMTAKAADDLLTAQVNNSGIVQARTIDDLKGDIRLYAHNGTTTLSGTLDASAPYGGDGGFIETSGNVVKVDDGATVTTKSATGSNGTWLIDPDGFTIGTGGDISATLLGSLLGTGNIVLSSTSGSGGDGNINVNDAIAWSADTTLGLNATNDININMAITASGDNAGLTLTAGDDININNAVTLSGTNAALAMTYGGDYNILTKASYSGTTTDASGNVVAKTDTSGGVYGSINLTNDANANGLTINGTNFTLIHSVSQLDLLDGRDATTKTTSGTATGSYALAENLDAAGKTYVYSLIGKLNGRLAGLGHSISDLTISTTKGDVALIGEAKAGSVIRDIGLSNVDITGRDQTGLAALVSSNRGSITNAWATGKVASIQTNPDPSNFMNMFYGAGVGGLVAANMNTGSINRSYAGVEVTGVTTIGGLVGSSDGTIANCHATGNVTQQSDAGILGFTTGNMIGGLVGNAGGPISNSYSTGNVTAEARQGGAIMSQAVGGLVGSSDATITNSYSTGNVTGGMGVGGLVGMFDQGTGSLISGSHATGTVTGSGWTGGFVGYADHNTSISNSYATGAVTSDGALAVGVGGFAGVTQAAITDSYATGDVTGSDAKDAVGGFAGVNEGTIRGCYALGNVTNTGETTPDALKTGNGTGAFVGANRVNGQYHGEIADSYAKGDVNVAADWQADWGPVSGFAGRNQGTIDGSTGTGSVIGPPVENVVAGLVGNNTGTVTNSRYHDVKAEAAAARAAAEAAEARQYQEALQAVFESNATNLGGQTAGQSLQQGGSQQQALQSGSNPLGQQQQTSLEGNIVFAGSHSAHIKSINVDGVGYELEGDSSDKR